VTQTVAVRTTGASVGELLAGAVAELEGAGCETCRLDAEVLLAHLLGVSRAELLADPAREPDEQQEGAFAELVRRRGHDREPVAYITGRRGFRQIELRVDSRVLVPRPETELLVECALGLANGTRVLDVGTGSGAVALALKAERADLSVAGSDRSAAALAVARENRTLLGLDVSLFRADLLDGVRDEFEAVLCNPPYVAEDERASLAPEIVRHEPPEALFAGPDGLAVIRRLADQLSKRPRVRFAAIELGAGQSAQARAIFADLGFGSLRLARDLAGVERVLVVAREG